MPPPRVLIVGGGIAGLSLAYWLTHLAPERAPTVEIVEAAERPGGMIWTHREAGYQMEAGPEGYLNSHAAVAELAQQLGLLDDMIEVRLVEQTRYVGRGGRLHPLPQSPPQVARTGLLGPLAKPRLLAEMLIPPLTGKGLSVAEWATTRFGPGIYDLFDALATGIYAGDITRMSVDHAFPALRVMEREAGSLLRYVIRNQRRLAGSALMAPRAGMGHFIDALAKAVATRGVRLHLDRPVTALEREGNGGAVGGRGGVANGVAGFTLRTPDGDLRGEAVVLALAPNQARALLPEAWRDGWPDQRTAPMTVVGLGFPRRAFRRPPRGFGFLLPASEGSFCLGILFASAVLPGRAPPDHCFVQVMVGGVRHPDRAAMPAAELVVGCLRDLAQYVGFAGSRPPEPSFVHVIRHPLGIAQLELGHETIVSRVAALEQAHPGLHFTGMGYRTVSVAGVVEATRALARRMLGVEA